MDPSDSYFLFADLVGFYTHWTYMQGYHKWVLAHSSSCFFSYLTDFNYLPLIPTLPPKKVAGYSWIRSKIDVFSYISLIFTYFIFYSEPCLIYYMLSVKDGNSWWKRFFLRWNKQDILCFWNILNDKSHRILFSEQMYVMQNNIYNIFHSQERVF